MRGQHYLRKVAENNKLSTAFLHSTDARRNPWLISSSLPSGGKQTWLSDREMMD